MWTETYITIQREWNGKIVIIWINTEFICSNKPLDLLNNNRNSKVAFELNKLICEEWHDANDIEEIETEFDLVHLRYESHIELISEMNKLLDNKMKGYEGIKYNIEFRYFLRQGYDRKLIID